MPDESLPIESLSGTIRELSEDLPLVITAPTGSGKSTQVPRWCAKRGNVLVIEPRRVACRGLAKRVAELEQVELGGAVGYCVRDDHRFGSATRILFATPGVVLNWITDGTLAPYDTLIIDEFHERRLDTDLLLAVFLQRYLGRLIIMSATIEAKRIAKHIQGRHLHAEGRVFPVEVKYFPQQTLLPDPRQLEQRVSGALDRVAEETGDVLVFLPGKAEITRVSERLRKRAEFDLLELHGGLSLKHQSRVFEPSSRRRVVLATNVAETSITIPRIGTVIDSGLVRRTRYHNGRGVLTLVPVAEDSADQRAGRAGRTAAGVCYRLWSKEAILEKQTHAEIYREALGPLVLAAAACRVDFAGLPFLDPPKDYAVDSAREDLQVLGAIDSAGGITPRGERLFGLPIDAPLGGLLVEAEKQGCLEEAIDLVAVGSVSRALFTSDRRPSDEADDLRIGGCDATASILAMRAGEPKRHGLNRVVLEEARAIRRRLRGAFELSGMGSAKETIDRRALGRAALLADPRCVYLARRRRGRVFWGNGGTEIQLAKNSAVDETKTEAIAVLKSMAVGQGYRKTSIFAALAMPVPLNLLVELELGRETIGQVTLERGRVIATAERVYAGRVIDARETVPQGPLARKAIAELFLRGRIFAQSLEKTNARLHAVRLFRRLRLAGLVDADLDAGAWTNIARIPETRQWVDQRLEELGVTSGDDLTLLSGDDLLAANLPEPTRAWLDRRYPRNWSTGDAQFDIEYQFERREVTLIKTAGNRKSPPALATLPSFRGFKIRVRYHSKVWVLKERT